MCEGDDKTCPEFGLYHRKFKERLTVSDGRS